ncbi:MAG: molybdopterin-guanine dinucleotide biosynthesis protein B [Lachnospiraceae bacterium]|nr:molybdopterin-guanine dinucleotide biosynthesis protein B [Lachnospiraceae bacterium]MDY3224089.1 molybdopterin-guanine dinucleotide biosynthesis protein B [Lachnospiraceae bacterium]
MHTLIIGKRGVGKSTLINRIVEEIHPPLSGFRTKNLILMDEPGFMESEAKDFCRSVLAILDGSTPVIAAVKDKDTPFLNAVRNHPNCRCFYLDEENREALYPHILAFVKVQLKRAVCPGSIPVLGFGAYSNTGKTTFLERLIPLLKSRGLRLAVVKHDAHDFEIDKEGKDSWRFTKAGADMTLISSATKTAIIESRPRTFEENLFMLHDVDLILVEGYKQEQLPRMGICRKAAGKGLPGSAGDYVALISDDEKLTASASIPCFGLEDYEAVADFIEFCFFSK